MQVDKQTQTPIEISDDRSEGIQNTASRGNKLAI